ncbi:MAG TPA: phosphoribosyltransferase family protein [Chryseolinea sp.]|nr:phosphoribosyltransferase family protein [Chryseolinea sp.]
MTNSEGSEILRDFVSLFFPTPCMACGESLLKGEETICTSCLLELPETDHHLNSENPLLHRLSYRIPLRYGMACYRFTKNGRVQRLLHALKYKGHHEIGTRLGRVYGEKLVEAGTYDGFDLILPVPLHVSRLRKRGYNQSAKFGEGLAEKLMIPCTDKLIKRLQKTETQTRKSRVRRWENIANVFKVVVPELVKGRSILLVDDVITTGSTIEACANALFSEGARELSIACIAEA